MPRVTDLRLTASTNAFGAPHEDENEEDETCDECPVEDSPGREPVSKAAHVTKIPRGLRNSSSTISPG